MRNLLEICIDSVESGMIAETAGADMVELCDNLFEGGTTPGPGTIQAARENLSLGLNVMIRPRGGDFLYSELEFSIMKMDIVESKRAGADGVVFGILQANGEIDVERTKALVELSRPMRVTFHRAFDMTPDPFRSLESVIDSGADRILTSGHANFVHENIALVKKLVEMAGNRITIMPGSGIDESNLAEIISNTGAREFHLTGRSVMESRMKFRKEGIYMGGLKEIPEFSRKIVNKKRILAFRAILDSFE